LPVSRSTPRPWEASGFAPAWGRCGTASCEASTSPSEGKTVSRLHPDIGDDALFGGIDLAATLGGGTVTRTAGLLHRPGVLVLPMAERAKPRLAARLARALDDQKGLSLVALDEGAGPEERIPEAWPTDSRSTSTSPTSHCRTRPTCRSTPTPWSRRAASCVTSPCPTAPISDLAQVAFRLGITSLRAPLQALALARASAALSGDTEVGEPDLLTAVELVLAPRATQIPEAPAEEAQDPIAAGR
jgi:magnesium chelatase subunit D